MQIGAYLLVSMYVPFLQLRIIQFMETGYHIFLPIVTIKLCFYKKLFNSHQFLNV